MGSRTDNSIPTRKTLLSRLRDLSDQGSWQDFFNLYSKLVYNVARKAGFDHDAAQDVVQETFATVARHIPDFQYQPEVGSFKGWLLTITRTRIIDALRRRSIREDTHFVSREEPLSDHHLETHEVEDLSLNEIWDKEWRAHTLEWATEIIKRRVAPRHFQMFHLHVVEGVSALQVARRLGAKLPEVYFAKYKVSAQLRKEIARLENNRFTS